MNFLIKHELLRSICHDPTTRHQRADSIDDQKYLHDFQISEIKNLLPRFHKEIKGNSGSIIAKIQYLCQRFFFRGRYKRQKFLNFFWHCYIKLKPKNENGNRTLF